MPPASNHVRRLSALTPTAEGAATSLGSVFSNTAALVLLESFATARWSSGVSAQLQLEAQRILDKHPDNRVREDYKRAVSNAPPPMLGRADPEQIVEDYDPRADEEPYNLDRFVKQYSPATYEAIMDGTQDLRKQVGTDFSETLRKEFDKGGIFRDAAVITALLGGSFADPVNTALSLVPLAPVRYAGNITKTTTGVNIAGKMGSARATATTIQRQASLPSILALGIAQGARDAAYIAPIVAAAGAMDYFTQRGMNAEHDEAMAVLGARLLDIPATFAVRGVASVGLDLYARGGGRTIITRAGNRIGRMTASEYQKILARSKKDFAADTPEIDFTYEEARSILKDPDWIRKYRLNIQEMETPAEMPPDVMVAAPALAKDRAEFGRIVSNEPVVTPILKREQVEYALKKTGGNRNDFTEVEGGYRLSAEASDDMRRFVGNTFVELSEDAANFVSDISAKRNMDFGMDGRQLPWKDTDERQDFYKYFFGDEGGIRVPPQTRKRYLKYTDKALRARENDRDKMSELVAGNNLYRTQRLTRDQVEYVKEQMKLGDESFAQTEDGLYRLADETRPDAMRFINDNFVMASDDMQAFIKSVQRRSGVEFGMDGSFLPWRDGAKKSAFVHYFFGDESVNLPMDAMQLPDETERLLSALLAVAKDKPPRIPDLTQQMLARAEMAMSSGLPPQAIEGIGRGEQVDFLGIGKMQSVAVRASEVIIEPRFRNLSRGKLEGDFDEVMAGTMIFIKGRGEAKDSVIVVDGNKRVELAQQTGGNQTLRGWLLDENWDYGEALTWRAEKILADSDDPIGDFIRIMPYLKPDPRRSLIDYKDDPRYIQAEAIYKGLTLENRKAYLNEYELTPSHAVIITEITKDGKQQRALMDLAQEMEGRTDSEFRAKAAYLKNRQTRQAMIMRGLGMNKELDADDAAEFSVLVGGMLDSGFLGAKRSISLSKRWQDTAGENGRPATDVMIRALKRIKEFEGEDNTFRNKTAKRAAVEFAGMATKKGKPQAKIEFEEMYGDVMVNGEKAEGWSVVYWDADRVTLFEGADPVAQGTIRNVKKEMMEAFVSGENIREKYMTKLRQCISRG